VRRAYFDTSAITKLSHIEAYSHSLIDYLEQGDVEVSTSVLAEIEVARALRRVRVDASEAVQGFFLLALDEEVRREAAHIGSSSLRSLDAIHLATALAIGDRDLHFVTYDDRQAEAARAAGLYVVQPGRS
jgi:predicted nucleic acid-binding protein